MAFQIVHFRNVGHQAALPTILRKKVLGHVLFSAQSDLCQTFAVYDHFPKSCKPLIGHTLAYSTRFSGGATKTHQPPRAALVEEAAQNVCRKLNVQSSFFRSRKLPLKILQSRLHKGVVVDHPHVLPKFQATLHALIGIVHNAWYEGGQILPAP